MESLQSPRRDIVLCTTIPIWTWKVRLPLAPELPYSRDNMSDLASKVIKTSASVTGVQAKLSLEIDKGKKNETSRFTIVGLWGNYILKPHTTKICEGSPQKQPPVRTGASKNASSPSRQPFSRTGICFLAYSRPIKRGCAHTAY